MPLTMGVNLWSGGKSLGKRVKRRVVSRRRGIIMIMLRWVILIVFHFVC